MYKISDEVINLLVKTMKIWRAELTAGGKSSAETKIQRGVFQWDALSPLSYIIALLPIYAENAHLDTSSASQETINHLMYMDDIQLIAKNEKKNQLKP